MRFANATSSACDLHVYLFYIMNVVGGTRMKKGKKVDSTTEV